MASRATGTLISACLLWVFFLCAIITFFQFILVDNGTDQNKITNTPQHPHHEEEDDLERVTHKVYFDVEIDGKSAGMFLFLINFFFFWLY